MFSKLALIRQVTTAEFSTNVMLLISRWITIIFGIFILSAYFYKLHLATWVILVLAFCVCALPFLRSTPIQHSIQSTECERSFLMVLFQIKQKPKNYHPSSASSLILSFSASVISSSSPVVPPDAFNASSSWLVNDPRSSTELTSTSSINLPVIIVDIFSDKPPPRSFDRSPWLSANTSAPIPAANPPTPIATPARTFPVRLRIEL